MPALDTICPACGKRSSALVGELERADVFRCWSDGCSYSWTTPFLSYLMAWPGGPRRADLYTGRQYHSDLMTATGRPDYRARWSEDFRVAALRLDALERMGHGPGDRWSRAALDLGCSNGAFVSAALGRGWRAYGVDADGALLEDAATAHPELHGRLIASEHVPSTGGGWHLVTAHDVLEHFRDPFPVVRAVAAAMAPGGALVIEAPDPACDQAVIDGLAFRHLKPLEHPHLLSRETWLEMCVAAGLEPARTWTPVPTKLGVMVVKPLTAAPVLRAVP